MGDLDIIGSVLLGHEIVDQGHGTVFALFVIQEPDFLLLHRSDDVGD